MPINVHGYITHNTSYGIVTLNLIKELEALEREPFVFPSAGGIDAGEFYISKSVERSSGICDLRAPCLNVNHQYLMERSIGKGPRVGLTIFEMDRLTEYEVNQLNSLDLLIVCSKWAEEVCRKSGVLCRIKIAQLGYDPEIFLPFTQPTKCIFISIGKWEVRKDQDGIINAFNAAFSNENVELWMSMDNPFLPKEFLNAKISEYKQKLGNKLTILPRLRTQKEIAQIINHSYCYMSNSKAEGANLPLLESLACGKFAISPSWSGETEYTKGCFITEHTGTEIARDGKWFGVNPKMNMGHWCIPSQDSLIENMRLAYKKFQNGDLINEAGIHHVSQFTIKSTAEKVCAAIDSI